MTIIELFPWLVLIGGSILAGTYFFHKGASAGHAAFFAAIISLVIFSRTFRLLRLVADLWERSRNRAEQQEYANRQYLDPDDFGDHSAAANRFYECTICGNVISVSFAKDAACKCRNVSVSSGAHKVLIRDKTKAKLFSHSPRAGVAT